MILKEINPRAFGSHSTKHNDIQHNDIQHNDIQHNDIQHNNISITTFRILTFNIATFSTMILSIMTLSITILSLMTLCITIKKRDSQYNNAEHGGTMKNTYCLFQIKFITEYTNVQHIIITQI
jgi:hypothetical protein